MNLVTIDMEALASDIARLREELAEKEAVLRVAKDYAVKSPSNGETPASASTVPRVSGAELHGKATHEAAEIVMRAAGRAMKTAEVVAALKASGFGRNLKHIQNSVFTALTRKSDTFHKVDAGTWELVNGST